STPIRSTEAPSSVRGTRRRRARLSRGRREKTCSPADLSSLGSLYVHAKAMNISHSISDHDGRAVGSDCQCLGCTFQWYHSSADSLLQIPEPERTVARARHPVSTVGADRHNSHGPLVFSEGM